jgi:hypothetical protein
LAGFEVTLIGRFWVIPEEHHRAFQYLLAVSRSEWLRLTNRCLNKCRMP